MLAKILKDSICKYKTMQGYKVDRKVGWDTHGLPTEVAVEKLLGFTDKNDIEKYPEELKSKLTNISNASDGWLAYDVQSYDDFFKGLSDIIKKI